MFGGRNPRRMVKEIESLLILHQILTTLSDDPDELPEPNEGGDLPVMVEQNTPAAIQECEDAHQEREAAAGGIFQSGVALRDRIMDNIF